MRKTLIPALVSLSLLCINLFLPCSSKAYEYHLQFAPPPATVGGTNYRNVTSTGLQFNTDGTISGVGSYGQQQCGVRYCGPLSYHYESCTWDSLGNLLTSTVLSSAPVLPPILSTVGTEQIYAVNGPATIGHDTRGYGFIAYPASHYVWTTDIVYYTCAPYTCIDYVTQPNGGYQTVNWTPPTTFLVQLTSDGDLPLNITSTITQVVVSGHGTVGVGKVTSITGPCLTAPLPPGQNCQLSVTFDASGVTAPASTGYGYNVMSLELTSDAGASPTNALPGWSTHFTIAGIPLPPG